MIGRRSPPRTPGERTPGHAHAARREIRGMATRRSRRPTLTGSSLPNATKAARRARSWSGSSSGCRCLAWPSGASSHWRTPARRRAGPRAASSRRPWTPARWRPRVSSSTTPRRRTPALRAHAKAFAPFTPTTRAAPEMLPPRPSERGGVVVARCAAGLAGGAAGADTATDGCLPSSRPM